MIIKIKKGENPFFQMEKETINDKRLSFKARGILAYLLAKPDDWEINVSELEKNSERDGRDSIRSGLKELEEMGYLVKERVQDQETGQFRGWEYILYEKPQPKTDFPNSDNPTSDFPNSENPTQLIMYTTNNVLTNNITDYYYNKDKDEEKNVNNTIEEFKPKIYALYRQVFGKDLNQINAKKLFDYLNRVEPEVIKIALEKTAIGNGRTLSYTISILEKLISVGCTTKQQVEQYYSNTKKGEVVRTKGTKGKAKEKNKWQLSIDFEKFREN